MMTVSQKVFGYLSCGVLFWMGLSPFNVAWSSNELTIAPSPVLITDTIGESKPGKTIKGEVVRVDGENYFVKQEDGKLVRMHVDRTTHTKSPMKAKPGDNVEAKIDNQGHAISFLTDQPISH
jgi:hypothetical protein